ncbi:MAG: hypothetical protein NTW03_00540 [Verrucomicrobia bacterium]|nr:hypothetical protein [Verrucomicrobiota bacterium]
MKAKPNSSREVVSGQPSWRLNSRDVEAFVTVRGGHLGPVTFDRRRRKIQPFSVAPWAEEKSASALPPILQVLRGDFFCLPFGGNSTRYRGEQHPVHGETANAEWQFQSLEEKDHGVTLRLSLETTIRPGRVEKEISLVDGQNILYCRDTISGMSGPMNLGHHAMLKFPEEPESGLITTSHLHHGQVFPGQFEDGASFGYSCLKPGAEFRTLRSVPLAAGGVTDLGRYPARRGFEDLVMLINDLDVPFAWTAVTFPRQHYVWFALKNPRVLRQTVLWLSNGGRHYAPWSGRHTAVLGVEDVTSYFHCGLAESVRENPISAKGFPTHHLLDPKHPLVVPYIMGVVPVPPGFDRLMSMVPSAGDDAVFFVAASGKRIRVEVNTEFLIVR